MRVNTSNDETKEIRKNKTMIPGWLHGIPGINKQTPCNFVVNKQNKPLETGNLTRRRSTIRYYYVTQQLTQLITSHLSPLSPLTSHLSPLTSHLSPLTSHLSPLTSHLSHLSPLTSHLSPPLTSHLSPLTSHLSPLTSHLSPLTSQPPLITSHISPHHGYVGLLSYCL